MKIEIRKYPNRKFYDTLSRTYINHKEIIERVQQGYDVVIIDNRSKEDITSKTFSDVIYKRERDVLKDLDKSTLQSAIKDPNVLLKALTKTQGVS